MCLGTQATGVCVLYGNSLAACHVRGSVPDCFVSIHSALKMLFEARRIQDAIWVTWFTGKVIQNLSHPETPISFDLGRIQSWGLVNLNTSSILGLHFVQRSGFGDGGSRRVQLEFRICVLHVRRDSWKVSAAMSGVTTCRALRGNDPELVESGF